MVSCLKAPPPPHPQRQAARKTQMEDRLTTQALSRQGRGERGSPRSFAMLSHAGEGAGSAGARGTYRASALIMSAAFSAIIITAAAVLAETMVGITEASTTRRPSRPMTLRRGSTTAAGPVPMLQVPTGW